jgi:hypothetical protein
VNQLAVREPVGSAELQLPVPPRVNERADAARDAPAELPVHADDNRNPLWF